MIRKLGMAALLGVAFAMPAHEAAAQNTLGGAIFGGAAGAIVGGAVGGGRGAAIGAIIGAGTGAAIASEGDRRRGGYYWYQDGCYIQRGDGAYMRVDPRYCYYCSPRPACGERSDRIEDAIRVRGTLRGFICHHLRGDSPSPQPSPRKSGARELTEPAAVPQPNLIAF